MKRAFIFGISGKMGKMLCVCADKFGYTVVGGYDTVQHPTIPTFNNADEINIDFDVIIDFSRPQSLNALIATAKQRACPAVIATTGYSDNQIQQIHALSECVPIFRSANMSLGIAAVIAAAKSVKSILGDSFDIEIVEKHHNQKADAPSGTALLIADALTDKTNQVFNRSGARRHGEVGITSVRGGGVVGEHEIGFYSDNEIITISHSARSRSLFAFGAYKAADFLLGASAGQYDMNDVVKSL